MVNTNISMLKKGYSFSPALRPEEHRGNGEENSSRQENASLPEHCNRLAFIHLSPPIAFLLINIT